jgi:hypothetical protein
MIESNMVATVNLDCRLDLKTIAMHAKNSEYNPKVFDCSPDGVAAAVMVDATETTRDDTLAYMITFHTAFRRCYHAYS